MRSARWIGAARWTRLETARRLCDALGLAGEDRAMFLAAVRPENRGLHHVGRAVARPRTTGAATTLPRLTGVHPLPRQSGD